jgi:hypothetical protein
VLRQCYRPAVSVSRHEREFLTGTELVVLCLAFAAVCAAIAWAAASYSERNVMNVEISDLTRRFSRTRAVPGVSLQVISGGKKDVA